VFSWFGGKKNSFRSRLKVDPPIPDHYAGRVGCNIILKSDIMKTRTGVLHWIPRILCIFAILFISMFALDAFDPGLTIWQQLAGFAIHLIPSLILLILLVIAWKRELVGGIIFTLIGLGVTPFVYFHNYNLNHSAWISLGIIMITTFPFVLVGILFIVSHYKSTKTSDRLK
jgi:hypothetical protein